MTDIDPPYNEPQAVPSSIQQAITKAKEYLAKNDPYTAIGVLYGFPEIEEAGLGKLVWLLDKREFGCSKGDVQGVIELLEMYLDSKPYADTGGEVDPPSP